MDFAKYCRWKMANWEQRDQLCLHKRTRLVRDTTGCRETQNTPNYTVVPSRNSTKRTRLSTSSPS